MGRALLFLILCVAVVAFAAFVVSVVREAARAGKQIMRPVSGPDDRGTVMPKEIRKAAVVALIVLLFGVTSGWLGGV